VLESEVSYSEANIQLPGAMDATLFQQFLDTGKQTTTSEAWKNSGRYSKVWFLNSKLEAQRGDFTFKPRIYYNTWYHYHPVTGIINESSDWVWNLGMDLEGQYRHKDGSLVGGVTVRQEKVPDSRKYRYASVVTTSSHGRCADSATATGRILATCSDAKGALTEIDESTTLLSGIYLQESWRPGERWIVDIGGRYDQVHFKDNNNEIYKYDYASGRYVAGAGVTTLDKTFNLPAPKIAVSYKLDEAFHAYAMVAQAGQIPSTSEISNNPALNAPISRNHEIGLKGRGRGWMLDTSVYLTKVRDEIVQQNNGGVTDYLNAGRTDKKGFEFAGTLGIGAGFDLGGYYSWTDYKYKEFTELVGSVNMDRSGNTLPFVPREQYGLSIGWKSGPWRARLTSNTWGEYWLDNANTEKYKGWEWVSNLSVAYQWRANSLTLNVDNLFDKLYAFEVKKDTSGRVTYTAATPRTVTLTYRYNFR
jgi:iron complex outermembrane receptor protein